jgi:voltage-gated sodium channel
MIAPVMNQVQMLRTRVGDWIDAPRQQRAITAVIVFNAITLGLETSPGMRASWGGVLHLIDLAVLAIFCGELLLKLLARGGSFFRQGWNNFDFIIVAISLTPGSGPLSVLRMLRVFRLLRLLHKLPRLRAITESLLAALPSIGWISLLLGLAFYIFAIIATTLFGADFPAWFGTLGASMYSLFQIMTLESWSMGIVRPVMEIYPHAYLFFVPFILISTYTFLNLFIAVMVSTMQALHDKGEIAEVAPTHSHTEAEVALRQEVQLLRQAVDGLTRRLAATDARDDDEPARV